MDVYGTAFLGYVPQRRSSKISFRSAKTVFELSVATGMLAARRAVT